MSGYIGTQPVPQSTQTRDSFTATSGQVSFATGGYQSGYIDLYLNGIKLAAADYTATNNSDVVLAVGATTGDILEVVAYTAFNTANVTGAVDFTVTNNIVVGGTVDGVDIAARDAVLTSTTTTATAALPKAGGALTGNLSTNSLINIATPDETSLKIEHTDGPRVYFQLLNDNDGSGNYIGAESQELSFWTNNLKRMAITSAGKVLIGTTTEGQGQADNFTVSDSGNMGMTLRSTDSNECSIFFSDATSGAGEYAGSVQYVHSNDAMLFGTAGVARMTISSTGIVTKPYHPAFMAVSGTAGVMSSGIHQFNASSAFNANVFTLIAHNVGSHYNSGNSRFTAPVAGVYQFFGSMASASGNATQSYMAFEFYVNDSRRNDGWNNPAAGYQKTSFTRTFLLAAGDYVTPGYESAQVNNVLAGSTSAAYVHFGGQLLG